MEKMMNFETSLKKNSIPHGIEPMTSRESISSFICENILLSLKCHYSFAHFSAITEQEGIKFVPALDGVILLI